jgi:Protein of unknown function (DUF1329)
MMIRKCLAVIVITLLMMTYSGFALGAISSEEANKLGTTLTGSGAQKEGNSDGTIPPYTGGLHKPIPDFPGPCKKPNGCGLRPDPFSNEKPLFSINAANMDQYADKLTEGTKAMLKKYSSTYRIDIYPTHRTVAFPQWVLDNTKRVAQKAKTAKNGLTLVDAHAGIPFPIPKTGNEAMWNHIVRFEGTPAYFHFIGAVVDRAGRMTIGQEALGEQRYPYWEINDKSGIFFYHKKYYYGPARLAGQVLLLQDPLDQYEKGRRVWQYLVGQRRVKLTPEIAFDTPDPGTEGVSTCDDAWMFNGSMERFDFKLVGKREIYVPYNDYKMTYQSTEADLFKKDHMNPDLVRWELHRVWVVDSTLKKGKRHTYSRRVYYIDEDSWHIIAKDEYDPRGALYRVGYAYMAPSYEVPCAQTLTQMHYDLISGQYVLQYPGKEKKTGMYYPDPEPNRYWTADDLAGSGIR